jgi:hypothetical protein
MKCRPASFFHGRILLPQRAVKLKGSASAWRTRRVADDRLSDVRVFGQRVEEITRREAI